jgi:hypothetical protein
MRSTNLWKTSCLEHIHRRHGTDIEAEQTTANDGDGRDHVKITNDNLD